MIRAIRLGLASIILCTSVYTPSSSADGANAQCKLHVWTTEMFAVTENLGDPNQGGLVGALLHEAMRLRSPEGVKRQLETQLSAAEQQRIITELDLSKRLALPGYAVIFEPPASQPVWTFERLKSSERIAPQTGDCYAELAIISQQYFKQAIGTRLRTFVWYREYDSRGVLKAKLLDTTATKAIDFPAKSDAELPASAISIQKAFRENMIKVATDKLKRSPRL
ncbi:hypothetical protein K9B35_16785 [Sphingomonas sp. R647]|uniref:hypothetical protein n=1 Tax=Sphingomonas sp. R647 TaxID=2875233 RepID=UPI001CD375F3|nr:hypothetical protein [Sphingomonas sp. R647]MCA1199626.1 hypothetical protein [Sphingomonas sp. R647]